MKFTDLSVKSVTEKPFRMVLDGFSVVLDNETKIDLTGQWIEVLSTNSEAFKEARLQIERDIGLGQTFKPMEIQRIINASLISGWSFEEECTQANVISALECWPQPLIDKFTKFAEERVTLNFSMPNPKV